MTEILIQHRKFKVVRAKLLAYGTHNKAYINLHAGQVWEIMAVPSGKCNWYSVYRNGITLDIVEKDFKDLFREVEE